MKVLIVGAGIVGACLAYRFAEEGAEVVLLDGAGPAAGATGQSFGWVNASFYLDEAHHHLRVSSMEAHRRLADEVPGYFFDRSGCLWWEQDGRAMDLLAARLGVLGYPVEELATDAIRRCEPALGPAPIRALRFPTEGAVDGRAAVRALLDEATRLGAKVQCNRDVIALITQSGRITGAITGDGTMTADATILATGLGTGAMLAPLGVSLGIEASQGRLFMTRPLAPLLRTVQATPVGEVRQLPDGRLLMSYAANHQSVASNETATTPAEMLQRLRFLFPNVAFEHDATVVGTRPVPPGGRPCIGAVPGVDDLYVAVMHSGITLAPAVADGLVEGLLRGRFPSALTPYLPKRVPGSV
jgi:D-hydroxyproline dehydrogenase subunit beta